MLAVLKLKKECNVVVDIPKAVFSHWPIFNQIDLLYTVVNISLTFRYRMVNSNTKFSGVFLCFPRGHIWGEYIENFSSSLFDESNPLSIRYTGKYQKSHKKLILAYYDGVDNVYIDHFAKFKKITDIRFPFLEFLLVKFSKPILPGEKITIRFIYKTKNLLYQALHHNSLHFSYRFFDSNILLKSFKENEKVLLQYNIPALTNYDCNNNGGFDIFFYMPLEAKGNSFNVEPRSNLLASYDFKGRNIQTPFRKFCWNANRILKIHNNKPCEFGLFKDELNICGIFDLRTKPEVNIMNRDGIVVMNSKIENSNLSVTIDRTLNDNNIDFLRALLNDIKAECEKTSSITNEQKNIIISLIKSIDLQLKNQEEHSTNHRLLKITLDGLIEAASSVVTIIPKLSELLDQLKSIFL